MAVVGFIGECERVDVGIAVGAISILSWRVDWFDDEIKSDGIMPTERTSRLTKANISPIHFLFSCIECAYVLKDVLLNGCAICP